MLAVTRKPTVSNAKSYFRKRSNCEKILFAAKNLAAIKALNAKFSGRLLTFERGTRLAVTVW